MTTAPSTEIQKLQELIKDGFKELKENINQLDGKIEQVRDEIKGLDDRLRILELSQAETKGRMDEWKTAIQKIPDLAEKVGELKNWRQFLIITVTAVFSGFIGWFIRGGTFKP